MNITVGIPIFNAAATIKAVLDRLTMMRIPGLSVIVYDNGSFDGTRGLLGELNGSKYYSRKIGKDNCVLDFKFFAGVHESKHPYDNALRTRKLIAELAGTEYIFFLDADVILPPNALLALIEEAKIGNQMFIGIRYEPDCGHDHVMFGATLWKTADFMRLPDKYDPTKGCDCNYACKWATQEGRPAKYHSWLMAYHLKHY